MLPLIRPTAYSVRRFSRCCSSTSADVSSLSSTSTAAILDRFRKRSGIFKTQEEPRVVRREKVGPTAKVQPKDERQRDDQNRPMRGPTPKMPPVAQQQQHSKWPPDLDEQGLDAAHPAAMLASVNPLGGSHSAQEAAEQGLHEDIPQKGGKRVIDFADRHRANCAIFGAGLCSTGSLAIERLVVGPAAPEILFRPMRIPLMNTKKIRMVAAGLGFSLFASSRELYGSGLNNFYQIGGRQRRHGTFAVHDDGGEGAASWYIHGKRIQLPQDAGRIRAISAGRMHSIVLTFDEEAAEPADQCRVFCLGSNTHGQCGADPVANPSVTHNRQLELRHVKVPTNSEIITVHACLDTSFALSASGELFAWGLGTDGQLGNGNDQIQWQPERVGGDLDGERIVHIGGSTDTMLAVSDTGDVFLWGQNEYGQLGTLSDQPQVFHPRRVAFALGKVVQAEATGSSCIVCNAEGEVFTWGSEVLGFGPKVRQLERPMQLDAPLFASTIQEGHRVHRVFAGGCSMAALNECGHMFAWGANRHGSLALAHRSPQQYFPYQISFAERVKTASFGTGHSLFVTERY